MFAAVTEKQENDYAISGLQAAIGNSAEPSVRAHADQLRREASRQLDAAIAGRKRAAGEPSASEADAGGADMTDKTVPPGSATTEAGAKETERKLFEGLAGVKMFPMDPSGPGQPPGQMLPVSSFLSKKANQPAPQPEFVGPIEQAMRAHPGLTRAEVEEMAEAFGFSAAPAHDEQPPPTEKIPQPAPQLNEHEQAWAIELEALNARLRASGLTQRVTAPPKDMTQLTVTFHRAKQKPTKGEN